MELSQQLDRSTNEIRAKYNIHHDVTDERPFVRIVIIIHRGQLFWRFSFFESGQVRVETESLRGDSKGSWRWYSSTGQLTTNEEPRSRLSINRCQGSARLSRSTRPIYTGTEWNGCRGRLCEHRLLDGWIRHDRLLQIPNCTAHWRYLLSHPRIQTVQSNYYGFDIKVTKFCAFFCKMWR